MCRGGGDQGGLLPHSGLRRVCAYVCECVCVCVCVCVCARGLCPLGTHLPPSAKPLHPFLTGHFAE
jgi:hypothetical protein